VHKAKPVKLDDFGFDLWVNTDIYKSATGGEVFPYNKTVQEVMRGILSPELQKNLVDIIFTTLVGDDIKIKINGDYSILLNNADWKDRKYKAIKAIFRRNNTKP
jgi:hypothetical protein